MWSIFITVYLCEFSVLISPSPQKKADSLTIGLFCLITFNYTFPILYPVLLPVCYR